ncbi:MAG: IspD/TarI family cytidylyltransferase [Chlamydiota bacterium]
MYITLIFLCGGVGSRMQSSLPKQYLPLGEHPLFLHGLTPFLQEKRILHAVFVTHPEKKPLFPQHFPHSFALPGARRQDSVCSAIAKMPAPTTHILVHDGARPFIDLATIARLIDIGSNEDAAALAMPVASTIRQVGPDHFTEALIERSTLWEMQTPQMLRVDMARLGATRAEEKKITVTDDVALAELAGGRVRIVTGSDRNIKITTKADYLFAQYLHEKAV